MLIFCRKMNIPFEVYAFSDVYSRWFNSINQEFSDVPELLISKLRLLNFVSSRMDNKEFTYSCNILLNLHTNEFQKKLPFWMHYSFELDGTPLNTTVLVSDKVLDAFQERTKVQIVNAIYLTDGESHPIKHTGYEGYIGISNFTNKNFYLRNQRTKNIKLINLDNFFHPWIAETEECLKFLKQSTRHRLFGFRLIQAKKFQKYYSQFEKDDVKLAESKKLFGKQKFLQSGNSSFDEFYIIKTQSFESDDLDLGDAKTIGAMAKKFMESTGNNISGKLFLKKFVEFIS